MYVAHQGQHTVQATVRKGEGLVDAIIAPMGSSPLDVFADQPGPCPDRQQPHLRIHAINIFVRDQDQSLRFYLDQLGFSLVGDVRFGSGQRWVAVAPPDGSAVLSLVAPRPDSKECELIGRPTQVVFVTEDVVAKFQEWRKRGVRFQYAPRLKRIRYERSAPPSGSADFQLPPGHQAPIWGGVFTHLLQAYWKKSEQGSMDLSACSGLKRSRLGIPSAVAEVPCATDVIESARSTPKTPRIRMRIDLSRAD